MIYATEGLLAALDLTHLRVLDTMLREHSVRQTADRLCLTPSAISHALAKLRTVIGDDLFVRTSEGMMPTPRALLIAPSLRESLRLLELALSDPEFTPGKSRRSFRIACLPFVGSIYFREIAIALREQAPHIQIRLQRINERLIDDLAAGRVDMAIGAFGRHPDWIDCTPMVQEDLVFVMRTGGPFTGRRLTVNDLAQVTHIDVQTDDNEEHWTASYQARGGLERQVAPDDRVTIRDMLDSAGLTREVAMVVPDHVTALAVVGATDMIALVTRRAAGEAAREGGIDIFETPYPPSPLPIQMIWNQRLRDDRGLAWLRDVIFQTMVHGTRPGSADEVAPEGSSAGEEMGG